MKHPDRFDLERMRPANEPIAVRAFNFEIAQPGQPLVMGPGEMIRMHDRNAKPVRRCFEEGMIVLPCGPRSVRFRPTLSVTAEAIAEGVSRLEDAIAAIAG